MKNFRQIEKRYQITKMVRLSFRILALIFLSFTLIQCQKNFSQSIKAVQVSQTFPYILNDGSLHHYDTLNTKIYYYQNKILVSTSYFLKKMNGTKVLSDTIGWSYFVFKKNNIFGYYTDSNLNIFNKRCLVDSFLKQESAFIGNHYENFNKYNPQFIYDYYNKDESVFYKNFLFKNGDIDIKGNLYVDTLLLGFNKKLVNSEYSLSEKLDKKYKMKLTRIIVNGSARYYKDKNFFVDSYRQLFFFQEIEVKNKTEIMKYFNVVNSVP